MSPSAPPQVVMPQMPQAAVAPEPLALNAQDTRPKRKSTTPTFLGSAALPGQANAGWKTLIGQ
jgi:hypothetical protein